MSRRDVRPAGSVALIGAGPGDPGLITVRGLALLRGADVVVFDRLVSAALLRLASPDAELIDVGKTAGAHVRTQDQINQILVREARAGKTVVRLKGGDPFVFGRGAEEAAALRGAGIPVEIVPGVTAAIAGPGVAGIPVTHRDLAASLAIATAHEASGKAGSRLDWRALAAADTTVLLMGVERLSSAARALIEAGKHPETPAAIVMDASLPTQRTVVSTVAGLPAAAREAGIRAPAVVVIGAVVGMRAEIGGWDTRPLSGVRVLVTRTREQASELSSVLGELGAAVVEAPAIRVKPPSSWSSLDAAIGRIRSGTYAWVVLTSANGVASLVRRLGHAGLDARALGATKIAAVGTGTADALAQIGIGADLIPSAFTTAALGEAFPAGEGRALLARADVADPELAGAIGAKGWTVDEVVAYRVVGGGRMPAAVRAALLGGTIDVVTFASGGTVASFVAMLGERLPATVKVVCIGPITAAAATRAGLSVTATADPHTIPALAAAVLEATGRAPSARRRSRGRTRSG